MQPFLAVPGASYLDTGGLMFGSAQIAINIYGAGNGVYGFQIVNTSDGVNTVPPYTDLGAWDPESGTFQLTAIPDAGMTAGLLGFAFVGLAGLRRKSAST